MDKETEIFIMKMTQKMTLLMIENIELQAKIDIQEEKIAAYEQQHIEDAINAHEEKIEGKQND